MRYEQVSDNASGEENGSIATSLVDEQLLGDAHTPLADPSIALYETDDNINLALLGMKQKQERVKKEKQMKIGDNNVSDLGVVQAQIVGVGAQYTKITDECTVLVAHNNDTFEHQPNFRFSPRNKDKHQKPPSEVSGSREFKGHYMDAGNIKFDP